MEGERNLIECGKSALQQCELLLQSLLTKAARAGDYEAVLALTGMARGVAALIERASCGTRPAAPQAGSAPARQVTASRESPEVRESGAPYRSGGRPKRRRKKSARGKPGYPRFVRRGDYLVKIGWSKREKKEYEHRVPSASVSAVAEAIARAGGSADLITSEEFLPVSDPNTKLEIPAYQAYGVLAWLVKNELVVQHGRQGYTVQDSGLLPSRVEDLWTSIERQKGPL